jgi:calcineurin-like phosphoesterase family protein
MNVFFTSDPHFGHANVIKYCDRPFSSADEMDEALIERWNSVVRDADFVWVLGDVFFHQVSKCNEILSRLRGRKGLVLGNHDKIIRNQRPLQEKFSEVHPGLHRTHVAGTMVVMCHYPMLSWEGSHYGSFSLHGHCHGKIPFDPNYRRLDVGVDCHDFRPLAWEEVRARLEKVESQEERAHKARVAGS